MTRLVATSPAVQIAISDEPTRALIGPRSLYIVRLFAAVSSVAIYQMHPTKHKILSRIAFYTTRGKFNYTEHIDT